MEPQTVPTTVSLTNGEAAALTAGIDMWHLHDAPAAGLRSMKVTDGPVGARGARWFGESSACVPCASALGATWSRETVVEVARVLATETRRKGADVLLAPTVNLHRHPLAGRNFECFSEDPELTASLAAAFVTALQSEGVAACVKHLVANDQETDRHDISAEVPEVALRELYLRPFESAVQDGGAWAVMAAYNRLGGTHCSQNPWLLTDVLREEWAFDGVVMSDWWGTHDRAALAAGLDLEMPGPPLFLGPAVAAGIEAGEIEPSALGHAVARLLRLAERVGALDTGEPGVAPAVDHETSVDDPRDRAVLRTAAIESLVLLRNDAPPGDHRPLLPLSPGSVALVGPNAEATAIMGGGSASFVPHRSIGVLGALRERLGGTTPVSHHPGVAPAGALRPLRPRHCRVSSDPGAATGFLVEHFDTPEPADTPVLTETSLTAKLMWMGRPAPGVPETGSSLRLSTWFTPEVDGAHVFGLVTGGTGHLAVDGATVLDNRGAREPGEAFFGLGSDEIRTSVQLAAGVPVHVVAETAPLEGLAAGGLMVGHAAPIAADPLAEAVTAAAAAEVAVVVVGGDDAWETEGRDRSGFALPAGQPALVEAVCAANPHTVVVLNCGAPVDLSCADGAAAVLQIWYPGQEAGEAVVDVLLGEADPGGRLPTTFGRHLGDWASDANFPGAGGVVEYAEGLNTGYRGFDASGAEPAFCFGHGLSTTTFDWSSAALSADSLDTDGVAAGEVVTATATVANTGRRRGTEVVQCYLAPRVGDVVDPSRPPQHLAGFAKVHLDPGESAEVHIPLGWAALRRWVPGTGWAVPTGTWEVRLSASSRAHRATLALTVTR